MAHNEFTMLNKIVQTLDDERNDLYIHIDKKAKYVDLDEISSRVKYSKVIFLPRKKIYWGTYSIVDCELRMLKAAVHESYAYYHLISGVDLPLKSQDDLHAVFENENSEFVEYHSSGEYGDVFEDKVRYSYPLLKYVGKGIVRGKGFRKDIIRKLNYLQWKYTDRQQKRGIDRTKKFPDITIYKGSQWFSITDEFARYLLTKEKLIRKMFRWSNGPDEFFVPTILLNSEFRNRVKNYAFRQIDWTRGKPYSYTNDDFGELISCGALFARKVSYVHEPLLVERILAGISHENETVNDPRISVIVPCYNVKDYLEECVESLLVQSFDSYEILLVDDGSSDDTSAIVDRYADKYPNVRAIHKQNGGLSSARNAGLDAAKGDYIAFVDSDDLVYPDYLKSLYETATRCHAGITVCGYEKFENESGIVSFDEEKVLSGHEALRVLGDIYHPENVLFTVAWNKLYKAELFRKYRIPEGRIHEDVFAAHRLIGKAGLVAAIPDVLYRYRIRNGSITSPEKKQDVRHLDYSDGMLDRLKAMRNMYDADLEKQMAEANLRGLYEIMIDFDDDTVRKHRLIGWYRRRAIYVLLTHLNKMFRETRTNYIKISLFPRSMRKLLKEIRQREIDERNAESQRDSSNVQS